MAIICASPAQMSVGRLFTGIMIPGFLKVLLLSYLRGIAPADFTYRDMYMGIIPFVAMQLTTLAIVAAVQGTAA